TFRLPLRCCRKPAMRRSASSAENPHIPTPPRPPALLTAAARAGLLSQPIGAWRMGHLRLSLSVKAFLDHMHCPPDVPTNRAIVQQLESHFMVGRSRPDLT